MHRLTIWLLLFCYSLSAFGQHQPQWRVVQSIVLTNQTMPIQWTALFTPNRAGIYKLSAYMSGGGGTAGADWDLSVAWTDFTGAASDFDDLQVFTGPANWTQHSPSMLSIKAGTPLRYEVSSDGNTTGSDYNLIITIEELQ